MSIFGSLAAPSDDDHEVGCAIYVEDPPGSGSFEFSGKPCDCGLPRAPIVYQGSHVLPKESDPRGGYIDLALIPWHIGREHLEEIDGPPHPFLRFGVNDGTVVLTREHVQRIHAQLGYWLDWTGAGQRPERETPA